LYEFGAFILDASERRVTRDGERLPVTGKTLDVLRLLVEAEGRLVDRQTFNSLLWSEVLVEDRNLTVHISALRKALGAECIETVAKAGYRLALPVRQLAPPEAGKPPAHELPLVLSEARRQLEQVERVPSLRALGLFERALTLDPGNADAHAGLASTFVQLASTTIRRPLPLDEAAAMARESAARALAIDAGNGEALAALGRLRMIVDWDWRGADELLARAVAQAPGSVEAALNRSLLLSAVERHEEAVAELERARELAPRRRETLERLRLACWLAGDADRGLAALTEASALEPDARRPRFRRMIVLDHLGRHDEAMAERVTWFRLYGDESSADRMAQRARRQGPRAALTEWIALMARQEQWFEVALQAMAIGDREQALDGLERCVAERSDNAPFIKAFPPLRPLGGEPRYDRLLDRLGLLSQRQAA